MSWGEMIPQNCPRIWAQGVAFVPCLWCVGMRCVQSLPLPRGKAMANKLGMLFGSCCLWDFLPQWEGSGHHWHRLLWHRCLFGVRIPGVVSGWRN